MGAICQCGHTKDVHSGDRAQDFGCNVDGCYKSGNCNGWDPMTPAVPDPTVEALSDHQPPTNPPRAGRLNGTSTEERTLMADDTLPNPSCPFTEKGRCHGECPDNQHRICIDGEAYPK